ncbi:hypothetical protein L1887_63206 [Cichorium endivia]|nr:hypothetical protein L1887_63206 [Cichorium endivia]
MSSSTDASDSGESDSQRGVPKPLPSARIESPVSLFGTHPLLSDNLRASSGDGGASTPKRFVGTPDYLAPESILGIGMDDFAVDWWALGVILYEFLYGVPPFHAETPEKVFDNILSRRIDWEEDSVEVSDEARDLMEQLMCTDPKRRLGSGGPEEIKSHAFFKGYDWDNVTAEPGPFVPQVTDPESTDYFDLRGASHQDFDDEPSHGPHGAHGTHEFARAIEGKPFVQTGLPPSRMRSRLEKALQTDKEAEHEDFGNFSYKNLPVLKQANDEVIRKMREEQMPALTRALEQSAIYTRHRSFSAKGRPAQRVHSQTLAGPPSPAQSASSQGSTPSRGTAPTSPSAQLAGLAHRRRTSELPPPTAAVLAAAAASTPDGGSQTDRALPSPSAALASGIVDRRRQQLVEAAAGERGSDATRCRRGCAPSRQEGGASRLCECAGECERGGGNGSGFTHSGGVADAGDERVASDGGRHGPWRGDCVSDRGGQPDCAEDARDDPGQVGLPMRGGAGRGGGGAAGDGRVEVWGNVYRCDAADRGRAGRYADEDGRVRDAVAARLYADAGRSGGRDGQWTGDGRGVGCRFRHRECRPRLEAAVEKVDAGEEDGGERGEAEYAAGHSSSRSSGSRSSGSRSSGSRSRRVGAPHAVLVVAAGQLGAELAADGSDGQGRQASVDEEDGRGGRRPRSRHGRDAEQGGREWGGDDARKDGGGDGGPRWSVDPIWARAGWREEERMMTFGLGHLRISASISAPRGAKKSRLPEKGPLLETPGRVRLGRSAELLQNCRLVMRTWSATLLCSTCTVIFCMLGNRVAVQPTVVGFDGIKDPMRLLLSARASGRSEVKRVRSWAKINAKRSGRTHEEAKKKVEFEDVFFDPLVGRRVGGGGGLGTFGPLARLVQHRVLGCNPKQLQAVQAVHSTSQQPNPKLKSIISLSLNSILLAHPHPHRHTLLVLLDFFPLVHPFNITSRRRNWRREHTHSPSSSTTTTTTTTTTSPC